MWVGSGIAELVDADPRRVSEAGLRRERSVTEADSTDHRTFLRRETRHADDWNPASKDLVSFHYVAYLV